MTNQTLTYADAGVDIDAGNTLVERIKPAVKSTKRAGVMGSIGGFGGLFDLKETGYKDPLLVAATDGVGTKLLVAQATNRFDTVGIDLVAMCVNDLIVQGAEPLFFLDYYACGALDVDAAQSVVEGIAEGCKQAGAALIGGETAEMPGLYPKGEYDLAGFCVGAVEREAILPKTAELKAGDVLLGLASSGVHSNGYSLVRKIIEKSGLNYSDDAPFASGQSLADALLAPTRIYVKSCLEVIKAGHVSALAHITGGGLSENIPRVLPDELAAHIDLSSWKLPPIFSWLKQEAHLDNAELLRTFNAGIGMVLVVPEAKAEACRAQLTEAGEEVFTLGSLAKREQYAVVYEGELA